MAIIITKDNQTFQIEIRVYDRAEERRAEQNRTIPNTGYDGLYSYGWDAMLQDKIWPSRSKNKIEIE